MIHYQFARPGPQPDWTPGREDFDAMFVFAHDILRFHRGAGFRLRERPGDFGPIRTFAQLDAFLRARLDAARLDVIIDAQAVSDSFDLIFRRHTVSDDKGQLVIDHAASLKGYPYHLGLMDCSGLTKVCIEAVTGLVLPHNAHDQRMDPRVIPITRSQLKVGDLVFIHNDAHVALWAGSSLRYPGGPTVWDTEPSDTTSPRGWPTAQLGTGVQLRPAYEPWYCGDQNAYGRIEAVNGAP